MTKTHLTPSDLWFEAENVIPSGQVLSKAELPYDPDEPLKFKVWLERRKYHAPVGGENALASITEGQREALKRFHKAAEAIRDAMRETIRQDNARE